MLGRGCQAPAGILQGEAFGTLPGHCAPGPGPYKMEETFECDRASFHCCLLLDSDVMRGDASSS